MRVKPILPLSVILIGLLTCALTPRPARTQQRGLGIGQASSSDNGSYYALLIGNDAYQSLPKLRTAAADAREVERVLRESYGFQTKLLVNATRAQIVAALSAYRRELGADASLLVYYAGHGYRDGEADKAYWLPVDATLDDVSNWIIADEITTGIRVIPARHVLVVSDSCYSGTLTRGLGVSLTRPSERERYLQKMSAGHSRTLMASGGDEPVADSGGGGHSIFASALLRGLRQMDKPQFTAAELFGNYIIEFVAGRAEQTPVYDPLRNSGHEGGDFVFTKVKPDSKSADATTETSPATPPKRMQNRAGIEFVWIPQGSFMMGSSDADVQRAYEQAQRENGNAQVEWLKPEQPAHRVTIARGFYMGKYEVTQAQWQAIMGDNPSHFKGCDNCPVEMVSWDDAVSFIAKLNAQNDGYTYRLPSEAEWEYAARAGVTGDYAGDLDAMTWNFNNSGDARLGGEWSYDKLEANNNRTHPVGSKQPNAFGLFDMHGNVLEWVQDLYHDSYAGAPADGSAWSGGGEQKYRVLRGGSWSSRPFSLRPARRLREVPDLRNIHNGVRVVAIART